MNNIQALQEIDFFKWVVTAFMLLAAIIAGYEIITKFMAIIGKPIGAIKQRKEDHDLVKQNAEEIEKLKTKHDKDIKQTEKQEGEISTLIEKLHNEMGQFASNRVSDRQQSLRIQKELTDSIKELAKSQEDRDKQIAALMEGSKELLGDTIDQRYDKYISLKGIPQNEIDEFDAIYNAYKGLNGNHGRQTKYEYVKKHLPVLPVKTEIIIEE